MAKSLRSKREKRLRAIRREIVEPIYDKKDAAKLAVQEAALAAPKLPVRTYSTAAASTSMDVALAETAITADAASMDVEMHDDSQGKNSLKPSGGIGKKKLKKNLKVGKNKHRGKGGKFRKRNI